MTVGIPQRTLTFLDKLGWQPFFMQQTSVDDLEHYIPGSISWGISLSSATAKGPEVISSPLLAFVNAIWLRGQQLP